MLTRLRFWLLTLLLLLPATAIQAKSSGNSGKNRLFIEASLDNATPWVGQEVLLTYTLFFSASAPQIEDRTKPEHPGLWVREIDPENYIDSTPVAVNGTLFRKAVIKQLRLVPMQSGKLSVANYRLRCLTPKTGDVSLDTRNDIETIVTAPPATLSARALPGPAPADFSGAVGRFSISVSPETSTMHTGEALSLFVTISGKGNLDAQPTLTVTIPEGFQRTESAVPAIVSSKTAPSARSVTTRITLTAVKNGTFRFRPVRLTLFDPEKERYETIGSNEIVVRTLPGKALTAPDTAVQAPPSPKPAPAEEQKLFAPESLIMLVMAASVLVIIFGLHARHLKTTGKTPVQPPPVKKQSTKAKTPESAASAPPTPKSPESLRRALYEAIKKTGIGNPAGLTSGELSSRMEKKKVSKQTVAEIIKLLATIDHATYTPGKTSPEEIEAMNRNALRIISELSGR